eukprot:227017_1
MESKTVCQYQSTLIKSCLCILITLILCLGLFSWYFPDDTLNIGQTTDDSSTILSVQKENGSTYKFRYPWKENVNKDNVDEEDILIQLSPKTSAFLYGLVFVITIMNIMCCLQKHCLKSIPISSINQSKHCNSTKQIGEDQIFIV